MEGADFLTTCVLECDSLGSRGDSRQGWRSGEAHCQTGAGHLTGTQPVRKGGEEVASTVVYKVSTILCIKWSLLSPLPTSQPS